MFIYLLVLYICLYIVLFMFLLKENVNVSLINAIIRPLSGAPCITNNCFKPMFNSVFKGA